LIDIHNIDFLGWVKDSETYSNGHYGNSLKTNISIENHEEIKKLIQNYFSQESFLSSFLRSMYEFNNS
jgi:hypothetical protein